MIPQCLVLLTSVAFAVSVINLGRRNVLVNELPAVEGLARIDVLCLDKTGTLTDGNLMFDSIVQLTDAADAEQALGAISSATSFQNPTLAAIGAAFTAPESWRVLGSVPFSSQRKWSAVDFGEHGCWFLGAPEILLAASAADSIIDDKISAFTESGFRVLMLSRSDSWPEPGTLPSLLKPSALVLLDEKIRDYVPDAMRYFAEQGVTIKVIGWCNYSCQHIDFFYYFRNFTRYNIGRIHVCGNPGTGFHQPVGGCNHGSSADISEDWFDIYACVCTCYCICNAIPKVLFCPDHFPICAFRFSRHYHFDCCFSYRGSLASGNPKNY